MNAPCTTQAQQIPIIKVYTATNQYWPTPGLIFAIVECVGGGGGGGGAIAQFTGTAAPGWIAGGGGGGAGGYSKSVLSFAQVANGVNVTIGAGGTQGSSTVQGGPGGATSFGTFCVANGGMGAQFNNTTTEFGYGGQGGVIGSGNVAVAGSGGGIGGSVYWDPGQGSVIVASGIGGSSYYGGAGIAVVVGGSPAALNGEWGAAGGGGCGGVSGQVGYPAWGGQGGAGMCVVTEYFAAGASPSSGCFTDVPAGWGVAVR